MKKTILLIVLCLNFYFATAQQNFNFHEQADYALYLLKNKMPEDCIFLIKNENNINYSIDQKDSINNFIGHAFYDCERFDSAAFYLSSISTNFIRYNECKYISAYAFTTICDYSKGVEQLKKIDSSDIKNKELTNFELSGIYLLLRDTLNFSKISKSFTYNLNETSEQEKKILQLNDEIKNNKIKSGLLAGIMSAVIPGLGKIYAGKIGQGASSFLPVTLMGVMAYESYMKAGISSARFIFSAGLFSIFYIGNIWGSILSVSVSRNEKNNEINNKILFSLRIPLQKFIGIYQ